MKLSTFLSIVAIVALVFGIGFVTVPAAALATYGVDASRETTFMTRFFGDELIIVGLILWLARASTDLICQRALVLAGLVGSIIGFCVALQGQLNGVVNALGWSTVVLYVIFAVGFASYQFRSRR